MKRLLTILTAIMLFQGIARAQQFPVQVTPQLLPPYSVQVSDYYSPGAAGTKLNLLLLLRDFNKPQLQVRLRMSIEGQSVSLRTREDAVFTPITIESGTPTYVDPSELAQYFNPDNLDFSGITRQQYMQTGKLPEGFYTFCFEAIEITTNQSVSNKGCTFAWMTLNEPPILNIPRKAEGVIPGTTPLDIIFQWTPRHTASPTAAFTTDYTFSIVEMDVNDISPEAAFISRAPLHTDIVINTTISYNAGTLGLIEGKKYAWRVQAKAKNGVEDLATFRNQGYSETFWFIYQNNCAVPAGVTASAQGQRVTIEWNANPLHLEYKVEYRETNNADAVWFEIGNTLPRVSIADLKPGKTYEYRVGGACEYGRYTFGNVLTFTANDSLATTVPECGVDPNLTDPPQTLLQTFPVGDTIHAGDYDVIVTSITGQTSFSGEGYVKMSWLAGANVAVRFTNIEINTDKKLASGVIETTYDPTEGGIANIDEYIDVFVAGYGVGGVVSGEVTADTTFNFIIQMPDGIDIQVPTGYDNATGKGDGPITITVTPQGGGNPISYTVDQLPTTLQDKDGNIYQVNKDQQIISLGSKGGEQWVKSTNIKHIDTDKAVVKFVKYDDPKVQYAFDEWNDVYKKSKAFSKEYERLNDNYYVSAKAIAPGKTDYLKAVVRLTDNSLTPDSIQFVNGKGTIYTKTLLNDSTFEISVIGGPERDAQEIYALYPRVGTKTLNLGKVLVASYPRREYDVNLIPVNSDLSNIQALSDAINKIYNPFNIHIRLNKLEVFADMSWDINNNNKLDTDGDAFMSNYSKEMNILKNNYIRSKGIEANKAYLFILNSADNNEINGEMPRGKEFGVIFTNNSLSKATLISHELGHGIFALKHIFDGYGYEENELSANLMDYSLGESLSKYQWDLLHDPALVIGLLESDDDAKSAIVKTIPAEFLNSDSSTFTFITHGGQTINVSKNASEFVFHFGVMTFEGSHRLVTGALQEFKLNNVTYTVDFSGGISYKSSTGLIYENLTIPQGEKSVILAMPNEESLTLYKFNATNLLKYDHTSKAGVLEEKDFTILPFSTNNFPIKNSSNKILEYKLPKQLIGDQWKYDKVIFEKVHGFSTKPELFYISKIAQLRRAYEGYFVEFTSDKEDWFYPKLQSSSAYTPYGIPGPITYFRQGIWGAKIAAVNSELPQMFATDKVEYYKQMLTDLRTYIGNEIQTQGNFFDTVTIDASLYKVVKYVNNSSEVECAEINLEKIKVVLDIMIGGFTNGSRFSVENTKHQKAIVKILKTIKPQYFGQILDYLSDVNIIPILEQYLKNNSQTENYYTQYVDVVRTYIGSIGKPTTNQIISEGNVFHHLNKGPDYYTKIGPVDLSNASPEVVFFYRTKASYVPFDSKEPQHTGEKTLNYFSYILLKLDDDYTFNDKVIFSKKDFPDGVMISGIELYWLDKEQYEILSSKFTSFMIAGGAMVVTGPELAVAKGWRLMLAVADFQFAAKTFVNTSSQYQEIRANNPRAASFFDAWDAFNEVYGVCRITQLTAELAISKWAAVKAAANDVKNDASIANSIKTELKIDEIVVGVDNPNLLNSLRGKLTEEGYNALQTWKAGKTINYVDEFGTPLTGAQAEAKLFEELDAKIGYSNVIGTFIDDQSRLLVQCEGANQNSVFAIFENKNGKYIVYKFEPAYKPSANASIDVGISNNKLVPDYSRNMQGVASTDYLCPQSLLPPGKTPIVRIKMTGKRKGLNGDFHEANKAIGREDLGDKALEEYVWHHMDDFEIINGEAWCTMQLVKSDVHTAVVGMRHSGSVAQWKAYYGTPSNAPSSLYYVQ